MVSTAGRFVEIHLALFLTLSLFNERNLAYIIFIFYFSYLT